MITFEVGPCRLARCQNFGEFQTIILPILVNSHLPFNSSKHKSEIPSIILLAHIRIHLLLFQIFIFARRISSGLLHLYIDNTILPIQLAVLPLQQRSETQRQKGVEKHERCTDALAFDVTWALLRREHPCPQQGTALPDCIQDDNTHAASRIAALVIEDPGDDVSNRRKHTRCSEEGAEVSCANARTCGEQDVANSTDATEENDHEPALLDPIGVPSACHGDDPGDEIRGC